MRTDNLVALDTNILVFADDPLHKKHAVARVLLEDVLLKKVRGCVTQQILAEYFAVVTNPGRAEHPVSSEEALERLTFLIRIRALRKVYPKRSTLKRCVEVCAQKGIRGTGILDAFFAMTLLDNGVRRLKTNNARDFLPFEDLGLEVEDPFNPQSAV